MPERADGAFDGSAPGMTAIDADEIPEVTGGREHGAGRNADTGLASLAEQLEGIDADRKFAPQQIAAFRAGHTNSLGKIIRNRFPHSFDLILIGLTDGSK